MQAQTKYKSEIKTVSFGGEMVTIENLTPVLSQKERANRHREIEILLFNVLKKYNNMSVNNPRTTNPRTTV